MTQRAIKKKEGGEEGREEVGEEGSEERTPVEAQPRLSSSIAMA